MLAGLEIGRRIRSLGFRTIVDGRCTSICAMIWLAGVTRGVFAGARIGFHAARACLEDGCETSGVGNALIGAYLNQLGFDFPAVRYFTEAPPTSVRWLTAEKAREFNISIIRIDDSGQPAPTPEKKAYRIKLDDFPTTQRND